MDEEPAPLRILALHSFRTSGAIFENQLRRAGILTGGEGGGAAAATLQFAGVPALITFLDAPNAASGPPPPDVVAGGWPPPYREWFAATRVEVEEQGAEGEGASGGGKGGSGSEDDGGGSEGCSGRRRRRYRFEGLDGSERLIARALCEGRGYDGIVGFSQGAALGAAVAAMQLAVRSSSSSSRRRGGLGASGEEGGGGGEGEGERGRGGTGGAGKGGRGGWEHVSADLAAAPVPAFLVCIGAAMAPHPRHLAAFAGAAAAAAAAGGRAGPAAPPTPLLPLATAHLVGDADPVRAFSDRLARAFERPLVLRHARGHVVPRLDEGQARRLRAFLLGAVAAAGGGGGVSARSRL